MTLPRILRKSRLYSTSLSCIQESSSKIQTFYRRPLPSHLISINSVEGKQLFRESSASGHDSPFFNLVGNFTTQSEPTFCGLGSLSMVLNALEVDPGKTWKGIWRWYSDEILECCTPLELIRKQGINFAEFACIAKCNGLGVLAKRANESTLAEFKSHLKSVCAAQVNNQHLVVSFSRKELGQTGVGHFSPIAAYHPGRNMALVLDVARFKYPSYWISVDLLWKAMHPIDPSTNLPRGYFILSSPAGSSSGIVHFNSSFCLKSFSNTLEIAQKLPLLSLLSFEESIMSFKSSNSHSLRKELELHRDYSIVYEYFVSNPECHFLFGDSNSVLEERSALALLFFILTGPKDSRKLLSDSIRNELFKIEEQLNTKSINCTCRK